MPVHKKTHKQPVRVHNKLLQFHEAVHFPQKLTYAIAIP